MVEVFKTNVTPMSKAKMLIQSIEKHFPDYKTNFDLSDCDKILRVEGENISAKGLTDFLILSKYE